MHRCTFFKQVNRWFAGRAKSLDYILLHFCELVLLFFTWREHKYIQRKQFYFCVVFPEHTLYLKNNCFLIVLYLLWSNIHEQQLLSEAKQPWNTCLEDIFINGTFCIVISEQYLEKWKRIKERKCILPWSLIALYFEKNPKRNLDMTNEGKYYFLFTIKLCLSSFSYNKHMKRKHED